MANTTNLNLVKLSGSEKMKTYPANQAGNMDTIDSAFGAGFGLSGNPSVNTSINNLADGLAIVANGNAHAAITSGQYVYVRNHGSLSEGLYTATSNISANGTLSGSNLTADSAGGLNALNSKLSVSSLTECASLDAVKTYLSGVIATMNARESRVIGIITRFTDSGFSNGGYYEGNIYYISNNLSGFYAGVLYSITNAEFVNFSFNNGTWTFNSVNSNKSKIVYEDVNITNDNGINISAATGYKATYDKFLNAYVVGANYIATIIYTYNNLIYCRLKNIDTLSNVPAGDYTVRVFYKES